jgi:hypothetical protein
MYVRIFLCCAVLSRRRLAKGRSPVQGLLPKCLKGFIASEVNSLICGKYQSVRLLMYEDV